MTGARRTNRRTVMVDKAVFRARPVDDGFYKEWRGRYSDAAWAMLKKYSGKLS